MCRLLGPIPVQELIQTWSSIMQKTDSIVIGAVIAPPGETIVTANPDSMDATPLNSYGANTYSLAATQFYAFPTGPYTANWTSSPSSQWGAVAVVIELHTRYVDPPVNASLDIKYLGP